MFSVNIAVKQVEPSHYCGVIMKGVYEAIFEAQRQVENAPDTTIFVPPPAEPRKRNRHPNQDKNLRYRSGKKPGQQGQQVLDATSDDDNGNVATLAYDEQPSDDQPAPQTRSETWTQRRTREYNDYAQSLAGYKEQRAHCVPLHTSLTARIRASELAIVQNCLNESLRFHDCLKDMSLQDDLPATFVSSRPVTYFSMNCRHTVQLPTWFCHCCEKFYTASPISVCCWPTTACMPAAFIHESVLGQYSSMFRSGVGLNGKYSGHPPPLVYRFFHDCLHFSGLSNSHVITLLHNDVQVLLRRHRLCPMRLRLNLS